MYASGNGLQKNEEQALSWYRKAADAGDARGMTKLGVAYLVGLAGLSKDDAQALTWLRKAADAGEAGGMSDLGSMYVGGLGGLPKDDAEAVGWFRKGPDAGDTHGMSYLGSSYENRVRLLGGRFVIGAPKSEPKERTLTPRLSMTNRLYERWSSKHSQ
jgi:TPR repeat protein